MGQKQHEVFALTAENLAALDEISIKLIGFFGIASRKDGDVMFSEIRQNIALIEHVLTESMFPFYIEQMKILLLTRWSLSKADEEAFKLAVSAIAKAAADKRLQLRRIMLRNPHLPFTTTLLQHPHSCCLFGLYCLLYLPIVGLIAVILDLLTCRHCRRFSEAEKSWIFAQLDAHPELDSPAINAAIAKDMQALSVSMSGRTGGGTMKLVFWSGLSRLEFSSGPAVMADEYRLQLWSIPTPNASPVSPTHKFIMNHGLIGTTDLLV